MNTIKKIAIYSVFLSVALIVSCVLFPVTAKALSCEGNAGPATPGNIVLAQDSTVTVTVAFACPGSIDQDFFGISSPTQITFGNIHTTADGTVYNAGSFKAGTELILFLRNDSRGQIWYSGPASRNADGYVHADARNVSANQWTMAFNDSGYPAPTNNFNDLILTVTATPTATPVVASCTASPSSVNAGSPVTWSATATGGTGAYSYAWIGTDSFSGNSSTVSQTYTTAGTKVATVTVTSGKESTTANCSTTVVAQVPTLAVTCLASPSSVNVGSPITWSATATGGTGAYSYAWTGTDSLTGNSSVASNTYTTAGAKTATVTVTSGTQSTTANCSATVVAQTPSLAVTCSSNPSSLQIGGSTAFMSNVSGGTGSYTYNWAGACSGTGSTCSNTFNTAGTQTATVNVTSGSQTASASCSVAVSSNPINVTCYASPSSISSGQTATFISNITGGNGGYTYTWSGACTGNGSTCNNVIYASGTQSETVVVTSGSQSGVANCYVNIGQTCTINFQQRCNGNSMYWYDSCGNQGSYVGTCGQVNNANLTLTKTVRDLTTNTGFSTSTYANPSDMLMFMITIQTSGNQDVQNVFVRDILPANLIYNNQLVVARTNNAYNNYSGDIMSGLNLNTIPANQTVTITYQAQVAQALNFAFGTTTLNNVASVTSSAYGNPSATASVVVTKATVLGASTISTGLTNNFWVDSFFLPLLITLVLIWMWKAGMFFGIEKWLDSKRRTRRGYQAEKELSARVAQLQKSGK